MNNLLFTAVILALLYYFFYYLPQHKKLNALPPLKHHQATQTETMVTADTLHGPGAIQFPSAQLVADSETIKELYEEKSALLKDIQQKERTISGLNNSYDKLEKKQKEEITKLKEQLSEKEQKLKELAETEQSVDQLLNQLKDLSQDLD